MADKVDGTDNVYVLGVKSGHDIIPAVTPEQVDDMLTESMAIQYTTIDDFVEDLKRFSERPNIINYGALMKHLQQECVFHLSALSAAAIIKISEMQDELDVLREQRGC